MKLYIFRHGQTDGNVRNIVQGAGVDIELNETGRRQAERLAAELKGEGLDVIYASPMKRADETARIVAAAAGVPVIPMPGLEEVHFGEAEGMLSDEAKDKYKDVFSIIHDTSDPNWMDCFLRCPPAAYAGNVCWKIERGAALRKKRNINALPR